MIAKIIFDPSCFRPRTSGVKLGSKLGVSHCGFEEHGFLLYFIRRLEALTGYGTKEWPQFLQSA